MSKYSFSVSERYAVYTVHGERCYLCNKPIDFASMEIDHVIPESLLGTKHLSEVLNKYGLTSDFSINGFENWLPSCRKCNNEKSDHIFNPTPIIQVLLDKLAAKREKALELSQKADLAKKNR